MVFKSRAPDGLPLPVCSAPRDYFVRGSTKFVSSLHTLAAGKRLTVFCH